MEPTPWTLEELSERVRNALATLHVNQENGQVTDVPNARTIRYYATVGLLDRPASVGRTAMYGAHHLTQLVAIKRLQAGGLTLNQVQDKLTALDRASLEALAAVPAEARAEQHHPLAPAAPTRRSADFWSATPAAVEVLPVAPSAAQPLAGLTLPEGITLTFPSATPLSNDDIEALRAALGPVVDTLRARGLIIPTSDEPRKDQP